MEVGKVLVSIIIFLIWILFFTIVHIRAKHIDLEGVVAELIIGLLIAIFYKVILGWFAFIVCFILGLLLIYGICYFIKK